MTEEKKHDPTLSEELAKLNRLIQRTNSHKFRFVSAIVSSIGAIVGAAVMTLIFAPAIAAISKSIGFGDIWQFITGSGL
jgi:hypothetical protein